LFSSTWKLALRRHSGTKKEQREHGTQNEPPKVKTWKLHISSVSFHSQKLIRNYTTAGEAGQPGAQPIPAASEIKMREGNFKRIKMVTSINFEFY
jgi:hypothetical protein